MRGKRIPDEAARWMRIDRSEQARIVEWNDWKSRGSLIGLRADGSVVAIHALGLYARRARGWLMARGRAVGGGRAGTGGRNDGTGRRPESLNVGTDTAL